MKIGMLHSRIRVEEKLLLDEFRKRGIDIIKINDEDLVLDFTNMEELKTFDVILERSINHSRAHYSLQILNAFGIKTVNTAEVAHICGDKLLTTLRLCQHGVATPRVKVAYTEQSGLRAIEEMGYPVVMKPAVGSWGRLISKVNDREAAEALLEHKAVLGSYHHSTYYIQDYIKKGKGRDIRSFVVGDECIAAIYRTSEHWITNTARGGQASKCDIDSALADISVRAAKAVGGGVLAIDVFETDEGYSVNEVNYTMEFRNSIYTTGVDIPAKIVDYVISVGKGRN